MGAAIELRGDFGGDDLRRLARRNRDAKQERRLLALAVILDGVRRIEAAHVGGVGLRMVRDRVLRFDAEGSVGLIDGKAPGKVPTLTAEQRAVPENLTLLPPPRSPELNPVENLWQFLRDTRLSNRVFTGYSDIAAHCGAARNDLIDQPWRIR